jgi:phospholipase D1/2
MSDEIRDPEWQTVLRAGDTVWRVELARRAVVLVESCHYFEALRQACNEARRSILILGWDFDRRERLGRDDDDPTIEEFLCAVLDDKPDLHVHLLSWDYAFVYAAEREWFQDMHLRYLSHDRLHVKFDGAHPTGGSQHQKLVVIDDRVAFCGGIDLSRWRWDTAEHAPDDERRRDPDGEPYPPFHDAMMLVDGPVAAALGKLARDRWERCTASSVPPSHEPVDNDPWPESIDPQWTDCRIGIARTYPAYKGQEEIREVERLYVEVIRTARDYLYMENQYFTSRVIADALEQRLAEDSGPDIVLVLPHHTGGWLEQVTMDAIRKMRLTRLIESDHRGRLRIFFPHQPGLAEGDCISVHAKLLLADDCFVRIGSANTSNRSMGLDSECDLALIDTDGAGATALLHRLLAEHLDCAVDDVVRARESCDSLADACDRLRSDDGRSLRLLDPDRTSPTTAVEDEEDLVDPEEPIDAKFLVRRAVPSRQGHKGHRRLYAFLGFIGLLLVFAVTWRWTPLGDWLTADRLTSFLSLFENPGIRFLTVTLMILALTVLMVPLTPLVVASALLLGPWLGFASSMTGALLSGAAGFVAGQVMGGQLLERYSQSRIHRLSERLSERGILAVAVLRMVPIAPYTVVNIVAGASHLRLGRFMLGTAIGMAPGIAALSWFSDSLYQAVTDPSARSLGILGAATVVILVAVLSLRRLLKSS